MEDQTQIQEPVTTETQPAPQPEVVEKAEFEKIAKQAAKMKAELEKAKAALEADKIARMKEQNQWKELAEAREREAMEHKSKAEQIQQSYLNEKKFGALHSAVSKLNILPEALSDLDMLDLSSLEIETTSTGKINVLGADKFAERLKAMKPHWFQNKQPPAINGATQTVQDTAAPVTADAALKALKAGKTEEYQRIMNALMKQKAR